MQKLSLNLRSTRETTHTTRKQTCFPYDPCGHLLRKCSRILQRSLNMEENPSKLKHDKPIYLQIYLYKLYIRTYNISWIGRRSRFIPGHLPKNTYSVVRSSPTTNINLDPLHFLPGSCCTLYLQNGSLLQVIMMALTFFLRSLL